MKTLTVAFVVVAATLSGCATDPAVFAQQSSMQLCIDVLNFPPENVNRNARLAELSRRGETCSAYIGAARAQGQANAQRDAATTQMGLQLLQQGQARPPTQNTQPYPSQNTQTYNFNGRTVTCTTSGSTTNCF